MTMRKTQKPLAKQEAKSDAWPRFIERHDWQRKFGGTLAVYENSEYIVEKWACDPDCGMDFRLSIKRFDKQPIRNWRHLQRIKDEIAGPDRTAVEVFPPADEVTDTANIYHLWVFPVGTQLRFTLVPPEVKE